MDGPTPAPGSGTSIPRWRRPLETLPALREILDALASGAPAHVHKLVGASKALLAAEIVRRTGRPLLFVVAGEETADAARIDLETFLGKAPLYFAEHATAPYEVKVPHTEVSAARLQTLTALASGAADVIVATVQAMGERVPALPILREHLVTVTEGKPLDLDATLDRLTYLGYDRSAAVEEVGDYALRGGILDIYSLGGDNPIRIEIEYGEVASIREFDVRSQRSLRSMPSAVIVPRYEILLDEARIGRAVRDLSGIDPDAGHELAEAFEIEVYPPGIERIAARLGQEPASFLSYLPDDTVIVIEEPGLVWARAESHWEKILDAHARAREDFPHINAPSELFVDPETLQAETTRFAAVRFSDLSHEPGDARPIVVRSSPPSTFGRRIELWRGYLGELLADGLAVTILCDNEGQRTRLHELLIEDGLDVDLQLGVISAGFVLGEAGLAVLTDHEFFGRPRRRARPRRFKSGFGLKELRSLKPGSAIVHIEHGIGKFLGVTRLEVNGHLTDVCQLEYQGGDKLYVPVDQLDLIQRYASEEGKSPGLSRLGGTGWAKTKEKAKRAIQEIAGELVRTYALRKSHPGHAFSPDTPWQRELEGSFPFEETPDQLRAVEAVKQDMEAPTPMDRLLCGDVGYGKTEVAVRAAFKAVLGGKQVAMLVPTTILAEQHWNTFSERFREFPVRLDMLSRFRTAKERDEILAKAATGDLDMVIGTHALLAKSVRFKNLGLVIVDEEQRFGVAHKERLKQLRANVDVLTLTATPIPRTMNMSLLGVRDITVIQTPPQGRISVQTDIAEFDRELIQEALLREADRGGQSFFVHNRVESIHTMAVYIQKLCPQLRIAVGHGQMAERALERVMHDLIHGRIDVLVATMIIESGLDIPSVNTLLVNRADAFGLAQLYQLRGRVGRSTQKAFCTFLVPSDKALSETAMKRLRAIAEFDELGSGFALAMRDLEIRGAGNILGKEQSGHVVAVGFEMYVRLVEEAVRELRGLPLEERPEPRLTTDVDAYLPDDYVVDAEEKVAFYKRLADATEADEVESLAAELRDRFGRLAPPAQGLFDLRRLRVLGAQSRLSSISLRGHKIELEFAAPPAPEAMREWMKRITMPVEFATSGRFVMKATGGLAEALDLVTRLAGCEPAPAVGKEAR
jgi:transcription-repair coupling factor (superfamily II helicase)